MERGRPPVCIHCGSTHSVRKGHRRTKAMGIRQIRRCKDCGRKFTPRNQKVAPDPAVTAMPGQDARPAQQAAPVAATQEPVVDTGSQPASSPDQVVTAPKVEVANGNQG
jgi:hypothetical protein